MSKTDSTGTTSYKQAGAYVTDSLLKSTVSSTTTDYTPGVSSRVGFDSTFLHSGIKNADTQTDEGGDVSAMRRYDAFGNPVAAWGGWQGPFGYGGPYGYQTDPDHGLMLLGHRYYEAETGRFLTRDPIKDGRNWYGYCGASPVRWVDADGLQAATLVMAGGAAAIDGPFPFGDIVAIGILVWAGIGAVSEAHQNNQRESTREAHERGTARQRRDQGREKGDARRNIPKSEGPKRDRKTDPNYKRLGPKPKTLFLPLPESMPGDWDAKRQKWH